MLKALIVDDEEGICKMLKYHLANKGIEASVEHTLTGGFISCIPGFHNIIFLDINLPDGNGLEFIPALRAKDRFLKIVVISALNSKTEHQKAFEYGAYDFLGKPFSREVVLQLIDKIIRES